jgi:hypothetical protein
VRLPIFRKSRYLLVAETSSLVFWLHGSFIRIFAFLIAFIASMGRRHHWEADTDWASLCLLVLTIPPRKD